MRKEYENNIAKLIEEKLDIEMDKFKINNFVLDLLENKDEEIERLNNIINELEKWIKKFSFIAEFGTNRTYIEGQAVLNKLQELKGSDKE